jgi:hypothetical protein
MQRPVNHRTPPLDSVRRRNCEQARLTDAGLSDDEHGLATAFADLGEPFVEKRQFLLAADERCQTPFPRRLQAASHAPGVVHAMSTNGGRLALHGHGAEVGEGEVGPNVLDDLVAHEDLPRLGEREQPRGEVRRVADGRVVHPQVVTDLPDNHQAGVQSLPHLEVDATLGLQALMQPGQPVTDAERGMHGPDRMILVANRRTEERHEAISEELVYRALVPMDLGKHHIEGAVHQAVDVLGIQALGQRGEARDVHEEHGDELALTLQRAARDQNLLGEVRRRVGARRGEPSLRR